MSFRLKGIPLAWSFKPKKNNNTFDKDKKPKYIKDMVTVHEPHFHEKAKYKIDLKTLKHAKASFKLDSFSE
jgi:hypothetical protein